MSFFNKKKKENKIDLNQVQEIDIVQTTDAPIFDKKVKKDYVNPIQRHLHENKEENGVSVISNRKFDVFVNDTNIYPIDKNLHYRSNILETIPKFLATKTDDLQIKNDQPTLISKHRAINQYGYIDGLSDEQQKQAAVLKPLVSIKNMSVIFKEKQNKKYAVNNINFDINPYENMAFIGANGAGKTTTVETIAGINKPTHGEIKYNFAYKKTFQEGIGIQFQDSSYPRGITVKDVIDFMKNAYKIDKNKMSDTEFDHLLDVFMIKEFYHIEAKKLSGGQQQRLNVLLSLIHKPKVLFLDELATGLDIKVRHQLEEFVQQYCKQNHISIVLISHDMLEVEKMSTRVVILQLGVIKVDMYLDEIHYQYGSVDELVSRYI